MAHTTHPRLAREAASMPQHHHPRFQEAMIDRELLAQIRGLTSASVIEWGGLLIGCEMNGLPVYCLAAFPPQLKQTPTFCNFATRYRAALQIGLETAGLMGVLTRVDWFHTHPRFGVFLSGIDKVTYTAYRREDPDILALVYDPVTDTLGWFSDPHAPPRWVRQATVPLPPLLTEAVITAHAVLAMTGVPHIFHAGSAADRQLRVIRAQTLVALANILQDKLHAEGYDR